MANHGIDVRARYQKGQTNQLELWAAEDFLPPQLPSLDHLRPAHNLLSLLEDCHNYLYANEGMLKERIFREILKLISIKMIDERLCVKEGIRFGITAGEYRALGFGGERTFLQRIHSLYAQLHQTYPEVFTEPEILLSIRSLAYVVHKLQFVSLSDTPADVKGEAFQTFFTRYQRGDRGEFFTPYPIVELAVEMVQPSPEEDVIDPACGSGAFLLQTIRFVCNKYSHINKSDYIDTHIRGIDFNPDIAMAAQIRLCLEGATGKPIWCANALDKGLEMMENYDIVLANPPFGSRGKVDNPEILKHYDLAHRWYKTASGEWQRSNELLAGQTPEILFIELCLRLLRPGGRLAIVLPDGILQNTTTEHVRAWMRSQAELLAVVSIPQIAFVPYGTGIKTSLVLLQKHPSHVSQVFMAIPSKIGYDVKGQPLYQRDSKGNVIYDESGKPLLDSDLPNISFLYQMFRNGKSDWQSSIAFLTPRESLNHRFDAEHYQPRDSDLIIQIGRFPVRRLCEIADIVREGDNFRENGEEVIRYIAISDVSPQLSVVVSIQQISSHQAPSRAKYRVHRGDIITAVSGASTGTTNHATAIITEAEDGAICTNGFAVLRNFREVDPFYLLAFMRTDLFLRQIRRLLRGHAIPAITLDDLAAILVPVLPDEIQKHIAMKMKQSIESYKNALANNQAAIEILTDVFGKGNV